LSDHTTSSGHWLWSRHGALLFGLLVLTFGASFAIPVLSESPQAAREADAKAMLRELHAAQQRYCKERRDQRSPGACARRLSDLVVASLLPDELRLRQPDVGEFRDYLFEILTVSSRGDLGGVIVTCSPKPGVTGRSFLVNENGRILTSLGPAEEAE